ncbi:MAG: phosphate ABC transporter permease [Gammaproteobacteria bacterium RBG_16_51_14]|nr:MAG: phosphate ABC transporter permease [Gammaproteobacteria bacterium RBG_16_51_14]
MPDTDSSIAGILPDFATPAAIRHRRWRHIKDVTTRYLMGVGGVSIIIAIVLIAFYLLYVVAPMFHPAGMERVSEYPVPGGGSGGTLFYSMEEQHEIGLRVTTGAQAIFFATSTGEIHEQASTVIAVPAAISASARGDPTQRMVALGLADGTVKLFQHNYSVSYPKDVRVIEPHIDYPWGEDPIPVDGGGVALAWISVQADEEKATIVAFSNDSRLHLVSLEKEESMLDGAVTLNRTESEIALDNKEVVNLKLDVEQRELYVADADGFISYFDITRKAEPRLIQRIKAVPDGIRITSLEFLSGGISILVGDSRGTITQWFPVRDRENNYTLENIRHFSDQQAAIGSIAPEYNRKGFLAAGADGSLGIYHTTAQRTVKLIQMDSNRLSAIAVAPRANAALIENSNGNLQFWHIDNEYPEISWRTIWGKVWYESRDRPEYIWQSSSASSDFEPKFSLTPLVFGTFKAAFYAMLFAVPLAIMGAIYTAYFMSARLRGVVKPTIEIMAALPTVILGFIAGLWFAPYVEHHLAGILLLLMLLPLAVVCTAWSWRQLPVRLRQRLPDGWEAAILIPVLIAAMAVSIWLGQLAELNLFGGNFPLWLNQVLGIDYDQRNSLIVGIAIGFAVIPAIFSISEDALFEVPRHLTTGSLALGATPWQTLARVVLLTASPGIFSAIMIGLGRAVGETMIVVMATGNTAIMDWNIFQGFRALSANIAVEMPESEVGSTHYRILFLAGLVLFMVTFVFNTLAEVIRHRLRTKYSNL